MVREALPTQLSNPGASEAARGQIEPGVRIGHGEGAVRDAGVVSEDSRTTSQRPKIRDTLNISAMIEWNTSNSFKSVSS